jgi:hypothetical protein
VKGIVGTLRTFCELPWTGIHASDGLRPRPAPDSQRRNAPRPPGLSPDVNITKIRASGKCRIYGYRDGDVFHLLWFDRNHLIMPE